MKTNNLLISVMILMITLISCSKNDGKMPSVPVSSYNNIDTINLNSQSVNCNFSFNGDTCFFQYLGDTLDIYGKVFEFGCGKQVALVTENSDSILITTAELKEGNVDCNIVFDACFGIKLPNATNYQIVKFNGKIYKGFNK